MIRARTITSYPFSLLGQILSGIAYVIPVMANVLNRRGSLMKLGRFLQVLL